jgi:hypothetical protein
MIITVKTPPLSSSFLIRMKRISKGNESEKARVSAAKRER